MQKPKRDAEYIQWVAKAESATLKLLEETRLMHRPEMVEHLRVNMPNAEIVAVLLWGMKGIHARMKRLDALQALILTIVKAQPKIKPNELLTQMRRSEHRNVIDDIDEVDGEIHFKDKKGKGGYSAKISGLKDRLNRARKLLSSL